MNTHSLKLLWASSLALAGGIALAWLPACNDGGSSSVISASPLHPDVLLLDRFGNALDATATEPYSPRNTCGRCHDVDRIARGYHFQQGRTDAAGNIVTKDDYFGDGRKYIRSAGMYGKW